MKTKSLKFSINPEQNKYLNIDEQDTDVLRRYGQAMGTSMITAENHYEKSDAMHQLRKGQVPFIDGKRPLNVAAISFTDTGITGPIFQPFLIVHCHCSVS